MSSKDAPESVDEITGQTALPMARIKKIIQLDDDIVQCSSNATFVISVATEMFIQYLAEQGHNVVKSERKPRKNIQYRDLATAVSRIDNLEFLADVIPKTTTYKQFKEKKAKDSQAKGVEMEKGQRTLNGAPPSGPRVNGESTHQDHSRPEVNKPSISVMINPSNSQNTSMVDRTVGNQADHQDEDIEMAD
ncbi:Histone-like transcription factor [Aspergillus sclerotialis]|uniref:Histone-like transcription factor n=1 Tax=Aspergillus sclerotialis TaxID=2070753 RepID=A0A3A2Z6T0_9EURO|nr:Histone-like transcription factor [Aspergillus sclerotialis]